MFSDIDLVYKYLYVQSSENLGSIWDGWMECGAAQRASIFLSPYRSSLASALSTLPAVVSLCLSFAFRWTSYWNPQGFFLKHSIQAWDGKTYRYPLGDHRHHPDPSSHHGDWRTSVLKVKLTGSVQKWEIVAFLKRSRYDVTTDVRRL